MKFILGEKLEMSQIFDMEGNVLPVTLIKAGPCRVIQVKTKEKDGYRAIQVGFGKKKKLTKPLKGHLKKQGNFRYLREFRSEGNYKVGDKIDISIFKEGDLVKIIGISKGKGFQGVVKRHHFAGGPASHGHRHVLRRAGSIGSAYPQKVSKGRRMPGRMGGERVTIKKLKVVGVDVENNILSVRGAVPGKKGNLLKIIEG